MKIKIFLSGNPKSGKTSLVKKIVEEFGIDNFYGFWTEEIRENKVRTGFIIKTTWGEERKLADVNIRTPYRVGKYFVLKENIDNVAKKMLDELENNIDKIILIDEIGKMEMYSEYFNELVKVILEENYNILAVVHRNYVHLVPVYYWLDKGKWWDTYSKIKNDIAKIFKYRNTNNSHGYQSKSR